MSHLIGQRHLDSRLWQWMRYTVPKRYSFDYSDKWAAGYSRSVSTHVKETFTVHIYMIIMTILSLFCRFTPYTYSMYQQFCSDITVCFTIHSGMVEHGTADWKPAFICFNVNGQHHNKNTNSQQLFHDDNYLGWIGIDDQMMNILVPISISLPLCSTCTCLISLRYSPYCISN